MLADLLFVAALAMQSANRMPDVVVNIAPAELPTSARSAIEAAVPGMQIAGIERKEREGRVYLDVEGTRPGGEEVELDLLAEGGNWRVVEIQRDIAWSAVPSSVRRAVEASGRVIDPVRVIESRQTDGTIVFELFAPSDPKRPSLEVRLANGRATILREEWPH